MTDLGVCKHAVHTVDGGSQKGGTTGCDERWTVGRCVFDKLPPLTETNSSLDSFLIKIWANQYIFNRTPFLKALFLLRVFIN